MSQKDLLVLLLLVLAVVVGVQYVRFQVQIDSVEKTVAALVPDWNSQGEHTYRVKLLRELDKMGLEVSEEDLFTEKLVHEDRLRVVLDYEWPLQLLAWELPRRHRCELTATSLQI